jgi:phosphoribosylformylglycinamidine synthase
VADIPAVVAQMPAFGDVATLFGESASRAVVSVSADRLEMLLSLALAGGVPARRIGTVGGDRISIAIEGRVVVDELLADATQIWSGSIDRQFERTPALA